MRLRSRTVGLVLLFIVVAGILAPIAAAYDPFDVGATDPTSAIRKYGLMIWNIVMLVAGLVVVVELVIHGLRFANSGHNPQARALAQQALVSWAIGAAIVFGAAIITSMIKGFVLQ